MATFSAFVYRSLSNVQLSLSQIKYTHSEDLAGYAANQTYRKANQRSEKYHTRGRARVVLVLICYYVPGANMRETLGGGGGGSHPLEAYSIGPD